jgi:hypothetical protein
MLLGVVLSGCAARKPATGECGRPFEFTTDTFAYANELAWEYRYDEQGRWTTQRREPPPGYALHCFVVARSARQFFDNAVFDPNQPVADEATYRHLIRRVVSTNPRNPLAARKKIRIPGYANLRQFSLDQEQLLKAECGGARESYFQRGHWRMVFPFSRRGQAGRAEELREHLSENRPLVVHLVRFPALTINHAVVIFDAREHATGIEFVIYDPNRPEAPARLDYDTATRTFFLPANQYFSGGRVDVYEVYHQWNY